MRNLCILLAAVLSTPAAASQPISESLVECAALYDMSNRAFPERRETPDGERLENARAELLDAALGRAQEEGRSDAQGYVAELLPLKEAGWDAKGVQYVFTQDFRDWMGYCRSVSEHLGVDLTLE